MSLILEIILFGIVWALNARFTPRSQRGRVANGLKLYLTVRMVWLLLAWPISTEDGSRVPAWDLVLGVLQQIDATTFWTFALLGAVVRFAGVLGSMLRWMLVLAGQGIRMPFNHILGAFLIGRAIGFFLPSTAGLDAYKLYDAARFSGRTVEVTAGTVLEKVLGISGIFLTFLIALPFGISIFGDNASLVASITVPMATAIIGGLLVVLWYPGLVQWVIVNVPLPGKARLEGVVTRISEATAAYRDQKLLVLGMLFLSFTVHFTTAAMYFFIAHAIGAGEEAAFWPVVFGSSIQIFATVIGPTIGGIGIREAAQALTLGGLLGVGPAILSGALGFWVGEVPTLFGFLYWMVRGDDYRPAYCTVHGEQVDYEEAAKAAVALDPAGKEAEDAHDELLPPMAGRVVHNAGIGLGTGVLAGILIGVLETLVIAQGGFGGEAQVFWYAPLAYAVVLGGLALVGGAVLGVLPMEREEAEGWVPSLGMIGTLVPLGLFIVVFRLRRDVYLEQMPPLPVLLGVLVGFGLLTLLLFFLGRRIFGGPLRRLVQPPISLGLLAAVVVLGFIGAAVGVPAKEAPTPKPMTSALKDKPNTILIMVDTLRADILSCYGGPVKAENLCSFGREGDTFQGFSHASWTKPATASLLTSLLPSSHNAMSKPSSLSQDVVLLSEAFQEAGYATGGIVSNINLAESFGFDQGYDEYHYLGPDYLVWAQESSSKLILYQLTRQILLRFKGLRFGDFYQDSEVVNGVAFDWLERNEDSRFFLFLHYMDPHDPYFEHPYNGVGVARVSTPHPDASRAEELERLYRGEIEYLDANVGELIAKLKDLGVYDDTIIALVADHGEEFHEHGGWWHGLTLYEEQIHVPFLVKWRKGEKPIHPRTTQEVARMIDVAPTLLGRAGVPVPDAMQGIDLAGSPAERLAKDRQVFSEEDHEGNVLWSLRTRDYKLIRANAGNPRGVPEEEFFLIEGDPRETQNLAGPAYQDEIATLAEHADLQRRAAQGEAVTTGEAVEMTRAQCEQLKNLGYVEDCSHIPN